MKQHSRIRKWINFFPILAIRLYRKYISPLFPPTCRFEPSCSNYGLQAFGTHSFFKASWLTIWRVLRCNPFNPGGFDPVPPAPGSCENQTRDAAPEQLDTRDKGHTKSN